MNVVPAIEQIAAISQRKMHHSLFVVTMLERMACYTVENAIQENKAEFTVLFTMKI